MRPQSVRYSSLLNSDDFDAIFPESSSVQGGQGGVRPPGLDPSGDPTPSGSGLNQSNDESDESPNQATENDSKESNEKEETNWKRFKKLFKKKKTAFVDPEDGKFHSNDDLPNAPI